MKLYIAGPMSGYPEFNYPAFREAETRLRGLGYDVLNPADNKADDWVGYMRAGLRQVIDADAIAVLPDWQCSRGARIEVELACSLGLPVRPLERWEAA